MSLFEMLFDVASHYKPTPKELQTLRNSQAELRVDAVVAIRKLAEENDRLRLYCATLARLLLKKGIVSVAEISEMLDVVDVEDGMSDGKLTGRLLPGENPKRAPKPKPVFEKPIGKIPKPIK